ncbi:hypothetical protein SARC_09795 [Sphaeroforma arctica JP610]|uniref:Uncharacterized protein n=1 Tax=Sphaeroforma arctica JP610 TaxID=667725 RepID=A0A0L0FLX0_9EUKA|nr:hypothetical protein SARC_09795 [Sphaeroforma arctica JP610]KNC77750.1 hypothetical protein SARC_09795 [Sphaeroforma arctica JP610]|eukprot:XP_014151652.1 hypothetical protein SARC_09795 [Sphaeroforma arctica JP610]
MGRKKYLPNDASFLMHTAVDEKSSAPRPHLPIPRKVCVIARTHSANQDDWMRAYMYSMKSQTMGNFSLSLVNTDTGTHDTDIMTKERERFSRLVESMDDERITLAPTLPQNTPDTYGYVETDMELARLLANESCEYIHVSNADNLLNRAYFEYADEYMRRNIDLIGVSFVLHHARANHKNLPITTKFSMGNIDLACGVFRTETIKRCGITFLPTTRIFEADWYFFEKILKCPGTTKVAIPEVLLMHQ